MKKLDLLWGAVLVLIMLFLFIPTTQSMFVAASKQHVYLMAFAKFAVLASMGELMVMRLMSGDWRLPVGMLWRMIVWGFLGILIALMFNVNAAGVKAVMAKGLLPNFGGSFSFALATSVVTNCFFAPAFMALHRVSDTCIEMGEGKLMKMVALRRIEIFQRIDWAGFIDFIICKTVPLFWIPAHTITFMLPPEYRVLMAAMLSIVLGVILGYRKAK